MSSRRHLASIALPLAAILVGAVAVPALIATWDGVYSYDEMHAQPELRATSKDCDHQASTPITPGDKLFAFECRELATKAALSALDCQLALGCGNGTQAPMVNPDAATTLLARRALVVARLAQTPPIVLKPFALNRLNFFWWPVFFVMALAMSSWTAPRTNPIPRRWMFGTGVAFWLVSFIPNLVRQCTPLIEMRVISFVNARVSAASFIYQELEALVMNMLIALAIFRWLVHRQAACAPSAMAPEPGAERHLHTVSSEPVIGAGNARTRDTLITDLCGTLTKDLSTELSRWQLASIALGLFFGTSAAFYASNISNSGDLMYYPMAVGYELIGIVTWWVITQPVLGAWNAWSAARSSILEKTALEDPANIDGVLHLLEGIKPAPITSALVSAVVIALGFAMPFIQLVLHT